MLISSLLFVIGGFIFFGAIHASAESMEPKVSIKPVIPENQQNKEARYFDLRMKPNQKEQVVIQLTNQTKEQVHLKVAFADAKTTSQGVIDYSDNQHLRSKAPQELLFTQMISGPSDIVLKAQETKEVVFELLMPEGVFDGFVLGGIEFIEEISEQKESSTLTTQMSYLVGFKLSETDTELPYDLVLEEPRVGMKDYKNAILVSLANQNGRLINELKLSIQVIKKEEETVILQSHLESARIAPYSVIEIPVYLEDDLLDPGDYEIRIQAKSDEGFQKEWVEMFEVTKKDHELFKENDTLWIEDTTTNNKLIFFITVITLVILTVMLTIIYKYVLNKKRKKGVKQWKKRKK